MSEQLHLFDPLTFKQAGPPYRVVAQSFLAADLQESLEERWAPPWPEDDSEEALETWWRTATCQRCGQRRTAEGHDPCIARLPGVMHACCGHGLRRGAYLVMPGIGRLQGDEAKAKIRELGGNPP